MESRLKRMLASTLAIVIALPLGWIGAFKAETASASAGDTAVVVEWNFPNNPDDAIVDEAVETNESKTLTVVGTDDPTYNTNGALTESARAEGWDEGADVKSWQVEFATTGYDSLLLSSKQRSSDTGPRDFKVEYKIGEEGTWGELSGGAVLVAKNWTSGVISDLELPVSLANQPSVYLRWIMSSNLQVDQSVIGTEVDSGGANNIDDIVVTGNEITNEPIITLTGANPQVIERGETYIELGATASDYQDGDLTAEIEIDASEVDTAVVGSYTVVYSVTDADDNETSEERVVDVIDTAMPALTITDLVTNDPTPELTGTVDEDAAVTVTVAGEEYTADVAGGTWTTSITGELDEGAYEVTATATDPSDNTGDADGTLTIDITNPTLEDLADIEASAEVEITADATDESGIAAYTWSTISGPGLVAYETVANTVKIEADANGEYVVQLTVADNAGNEITKSFNLIWSSAANITEEDNTAVIPADASGDAQIIIAPDATDPEIDLGALSSVDEDGIVTVEVPDDLNITIQATIGGNPVVIEIAGGTKITGPVDWDGVLDLPRAGTLGLIIIPTTPGTAANSVVIELGLTSGSLTFEGPVKIVLSGLGGQQVGYINEEGQFVEITTICDDIDNPTTFSETGECKATTADGKDLVVWTKHLTKYAAYVETAVVSPVITATATIENGEKIIKIEWLGVGGGVEEYEILINGILAKISAVADDGNLPYVYKAKVNDYAKYGILVRAKRAGAYSANATQSFVEFIAPVVAPAPTTVAPVAVTTKATASVTSPAPAKAQAAGPKVEEPKVEDPAVDDGVIKGEEVNEDAEAAKTNWAPWIVLLILILLAGAVTGGYFYWFAGKEEETRSNNQRPAVKKPEVTVSQKKPQHQQQKKKRW